MWTRDEVDEIVSAQVHLKIIIPKKCKPIMTSIFSRPSFYWRDSTRQPSP